MKKPFSLQNAFDAWQERVLDDAVCVFGRIHQQDKLLEEMAELTQAVLKMREYIGRDVYLHRRTLTIGEIADVYITLRQLVKMLDCEDELSNVIAYKLNYLVAETRKEAERKYGHDKTEHTV